MKRFLGGILAVALSVQACTKKPDPIPATVLTGWVHFFGCPPSTKALLGPQHVVLIFSDGTSKVLRLDTATDEQWASLSALVGEMKGTIVVYQCNSSAAEL